MNGRRNTYSHFVTFERTGCAAAAKPPVGSKPPAIAPAPGQRRKRI